MAIKKRYNDNEIFDFLNAKIELEILKMAQMLSYVGNECVNIARQNHKYTDRTGNLTSSIGYCILRDGISIEESMFDAVKNGYKGSAKGRSFMNDLVNKHTDGIALIVVAGMEYATYVNAKGLDVLDSAELKAKELIKDFKRQLKLQ